MGVLDISFSLVFVLYYLLQCPSVNSYENGYDPLCKFDVKFNFTEECKNVPTDYFCTLGPDGQRWLHSLYEEAMTEEPRSLRKRREIRTLSATERNAFLNAVDALQRDKSVAPNKYEAFAMIHSNRTVCSIHYGYNFFGWHRIYLLLFETALRQIDKSVVIPYWDSLIDNNNITLPNNTVIFSEKFLGNGDGQVTSGPFKDWTDLYNCPVYRNIASGKSSLPQPEVIDMIVNNRTLIHTKQIVYRGLLTGDRPHILSLEGQHDFVHRWVGKLMSGLDTSSKDPVFFLHHAYIDFIWERFRKKQRSMNIEPKADYPDVVEEDNILGKLHAPNRTMDCFFWITNSEGYWNYFTETIYNYEDSPTCPDCGNSSFLTCNQELQRCIGKDDNVTERIVETPTTPTSISDRNSPFSSFIFVALCISFICYGITR